MVSWAERIVSAYLGSDIRCQHWSGDTCSRRLTTHQMLSNGSRTHAAGITPLDTLERLTLRMDVPSTCPGPPELIDHLRDVQVVPGVSDSSCAVLV
jgi:hypothetical protein